MKKGMIFSSITCFIVSILILFFANQSLAATYCVANEANLTAALNEAKDNGADDVIKIQQGTYSGNFDYASTESFGLTIEGGYTALCGSRVVDPANTIIDGGGAGTVLTVFNQDHPATFVMEGITLQNGNSASGFSGAGGSICNGGMTTLNNNTISNNSGGGFFLGSDCGGTIGTFTITNTTISNNSGCGIVGDYTRLNLTNNTFSNNSEFVIFGNYLEPLNLTNNTISNNDRGISLEFSSITLNDNIIRNSGGIYIFVGHIKANNNIFTNSGGISGDRISVNLTNNTMSNGGGVYLYNGSGTLVNNVIINGGGVYLYNYTGGHKIDIINNTISNNKSSKDGGGIYFYNEEEPGCIVNIFNNIIWNNNAAGSGADLYIYDWTSLSTINLYNNDFDQSANGTYIYPSFPIDSSNLDNADPLFVDPNNGDFHLSVNSPCIDAGAGIVSYGQTPDGNSYAQAAPGFDIDGDSRPRDNGYDIGADEYPGPEYWTPPRMRNAVPPDMGIVVP